MYKILLSRPAFLFFWLSQLTSTLGIHLYHMGAIVVVFQQSGSALQATGVLIARMLPKILLGPLAGALVDRYPRKQVLMGIELSRVGLALLSLLLAATEGGTVWAVYALVAGLAVTETFAQPAQMSLLPALAAPSELVHANSLLNSTNYGTMALSYALGGLLILALSMTHVVLVALALFVLAGALLTPIRSEPTSPTRLQGGLPLPHAISQGLDYLRRHDLARSLTVMEFLEHWPHGLWTSTLMLAFTTQALQASELYWGYQNALYFVGNLFGAGLAVAFAARIHQRPGWTIIVNAGLMCLLTISYALAPDVWLAMAVSLAFGPPMALRDVAQDVLLQSTVEPGMLGRVYATRQTLAMIAYMASSLGLAYLADLLPVRQIYLFGGILYGMTALYAMTRPALRRAQLQHIPPAAA